MFEDNVNDTSGNNYHGTAVGSPAFVTDTPTGTGKAINFNGSGDRYVKVDDGQNQTVFNGDKNSLYPHGSRSNQTVVGNLGFPSVEKVVVVGSCVVKVVEW